MKTTQYTIRDREAGNVISVHGTQERAEKELEQYEEIDRREGHYSVDFYEIKEWKGGAI